MAAPTAGQPTPEPLHAEEARTRPAALDARALPTDMAVRFTLLVTSVAAAALYLFQALWFVVRGEVFLAAVQECGALSVGALEAGSVVDTGAALQQQAACRAGMSLEQSLFAAAGVVLVFAVAYALYLALPWWRERRGRLERLDPQDGAALLAEVDRLSREAGLERPPEVVVDPVDPRTRAFVYGTRRRPRLAVAGGLVVLHVLDPPAFRAVLRHEVGHLANRDVGWTYFTLATWWSFLAVALVPVTLLFAVSDPRYVLRLGWRTALLAALVLLVRNSVLRAREVYADAAAGRDPGARAQLAGVLERHDGSARHRPPWLRRHPSNTERRRLLGDPDGLFRADGLVALAAGIAAGTSFHSVHAITALVLPPIWALWLPALALSVPAAGIVCVLTWRCALRSVVRGVPVPALAALGGGLGLGLALGPWLSFDAAAGALVLGTASAAGLVLWAAAVVTVVTVVARYAVDSAHLALAAAVRRPSPWPVLLPHAVAVALTIAVVLVLGDTWLVYLTTMGPLAGLVWQLWAYLPTASTPSNDSGVVLAVVLLLALAVLLPARLLRGDDQAPAAWPWRDHPPARLPALEPPRLRRALLVGAVAGAIAAAGHAVARSAAPALLDDAVWRSDAYRVSLGLGTTALLALAMVTGAAGAALTVRGRWWPAGIVGAAAALVVGSGLCLIAFVAAGCGLLPRAGPPDCSPPRAGELALLLGQPLDLALLPSAFAVGLVGVARAGRAARGHLVPALVLAATLTGLGGAGLLVAVAATDVPVERGPGYEVALPPVWQATPGEAAPVFATTNQRVRVTILPLEQAEPAVAGHASIEVGGVRAHFVGREAHGVVELRAYDLTIGGASFRVLVLGAPEALDAAGEELRMLLDGVVWTAPR